MKYTISVIDEPSWIEHIVELKNTDDMVMLEVELQPKRLGFIEGWKSDGSHEIDWVITDETLNAKNDGLCNLEIKAYKDCKMIATGSKYSTTIILVSQNYREKVVYSREVIVGTNQ